MNAVASRKSRAGKSATVGIDLGTTAEQGGRYRALTNLGRQAGLTTAERVNAWS